MVVLRRVNPLYSTHGLNSPNPLEWEHILSQLSVYGSIFSDNYNKHRESFWGTLESFSQISTNKSRKRKDCFIFFSDFSKIDLLNLCKRSHHVYIRYKKNINLGLFLFMQLYLYFHISIPSLLKYFISRKCREKWKESQICLSFLRYSLAY